MFLKEQGYIIIVLLLLLFINSKFDNTRKFISLMWNSMPTFGQTERPMCKWDNIKMAI
jgi:hypothetical protein